MSMKVISVEGLSKAYEVYAKPSDFLREVLFGKPRHDTFWALKDISFEVTEKQRVGIIGPNGSGKSTLLKIITGHLPPTTGTVRVDGVVSAMLGLNTVLNLEETGLSNIRFNLILNGCRKSDLDRLTEEIIEFTELGPFIYAPVRTYSSGMNAKLAFAISTAIKPEILVIDEVLSVGDAYFMGKATRRMIELCNQGKALIFVSHSTSAVQMLCDTAIWMENGMIRSMGPTDHIIKLYEEDYRRQEDEATREGNISRKIALGGSAHLSEMDSPKHCRVRLVPDNPNRVLEDTHYVRKVSVMGENVPEQDISLAVRDIRDEETFAALDLLGSEWGRPYTKGNHDCRILSAKTGKQRGGQILLKAPATDSPIWRLQIRVEACSILNKEKLGIEFLNYQTGNWQQAQVTLKPLENGWEEITAEIAVPMVDDKRYGETLKRVEQITRPDIEITQVQLTSNGQPTFVLTEQQSFKINVGIRANRLTPKVDVGIKIMRSDGVYVFWQSSGLCGNNLTDVDGGLVVSFVFENNLLSSGEYAVSAYAANGWDFPGNYPYSLVFDRKVNCMRFSVQNQLPGLDFGLLNVRVPVSCSRV